MPRRQSPSLPRQTLQLNEVTRAAVGEKGRLDTKNRLAGAPSLVQFPAMTNLNSVLNQLEQERSRLIVQLERLNSAISALNGTGRTVSAVSRARMAAAQRDRWAKAKGKKVVSIARGGRRKLSAAAISRIRAAQRARWAKWRKAQKSA